MLQMPGVGLCGLMLKNRFCDGAGLSRQSTEAHPAVQPLTSQHFIQQTLRILQSLVRSHARAKLGPLAAAAPHFAAALACAPVDDAIPFIQQALDPWGHGVQPGIVSVLGDAFCGALVRGVESQQQQGASTVTLAHMLPAAQARAVFEMPCACCSSGGRGASVMIKAHPDLCFIDDAGL